MPLGLYCQIFHTFPHPFSARDPKTERLWKKNPKVAFRQAHTSLVLAYDTDNRQVPCTEHFPSHITDITLYKPKHPEQKLCRGIAPLRQLHFSEAKDQGVQDRGALLGA